MKNIDEILANYFSGEATPEETLAVQEWKLLNEEEFELLSKAWAAADEVNVADFPTKEFDAKAALAKIEDQLQSPNQGRILKISFYKKVAAACAILMVGLAGFWFLTNRNSTELVANNTNAPKKIELPDHSQVWLAANANLTYATDFNENRTLTLTGEAYFEVERDEKHPFIINTDFGKVEVLGTAFNVNASDKSTSVSVEHGKVAVENKTGKVILTAGQSTVATEKMVAPVAPADPNFNAWKTGEFYFNNTPLNEVIRLLNAHYPKKIEYQGNATNQHFINGTFKNSKIEDIIDVIVLTCDLEAENGDNVIRLK